MNGNNSYQDRTSIKSTGEALFEVYCQRKNYSCVKLGFNNEPIRHFWDLNPLLKNIPDYVMDTGKELFVVQVKGTDNFKKSEYDLLPLFMEWYSTSKAPLVYAFCKRGHPIKFLFPEKVIELYKNSFDKKWPDGVVHRNLQIFDEGEENGTVTRNH